MRVSNIVMFIACLGIAIARPRDEPTRVNMAFIGGGAAGANGAVFGKDLGYSVAVFERMSTLGGHCDTIKITPPQPGLPDWIDIGVIVYGNTSWARANGYYNFSLSTDKYIQRFVPPGAVMTANFSASIPAWIADIQNKIGVFPAPPLSPEQQQAIGISLFTFITQMRTLYPWLDSISYPDPIPPELLVDFQTYLAANPYMTPVMQGIFGGLMTSSGYGSWNKLTTLYALKSLHPATTANYLPGNNGMLSIYGGCGAFYEGVQKYLGKSAYLNTTIKSVKRPGNSGKVHIEVSVNGRKKLFIADNLFVAVPQTLSGLSFMDLSKDEIKAFKGVDTRDYFAMEVDVEGQVNTTGNYAILNFNVLNPPYSEPSYPSVLALTRSLPYGPTPAWSASDNHIETSAMTEIVANQLNTIVNEMPFPAVSKANLMRIFKHTYQPYYSSHDLSKSPTPYTLIENLQGKKNTYYLGALMTFAESSMVMEHAYQLVTKNFPPKC